MMIAISK